MKLKLHIENLINLCDTLMRANKGNLLKNQKNLCW